ncbi:MAG TPA: hypothetical protein VHN14_16640, partial [Kofleriaceae bacterium]|nr:hypothetical protein [Kofleriaceae bacterium]
LHTEFVPRAAVFSMMCACAFGLIMMLPYFAYVFRFLEPVNLVARIQREAAGDVANAATTSDPDAIVDGQAPALAALEELTDITSNSISGKDKIIASRAVDAIKDFVVGYLDVKGRADSRWFQIGEQIRDNPDFVSMDSESLHELEVDHTWLEWKALRQYYGFYAEAQGDMPGQLPDRDRHPLRRRGRACQGRSRGDRARVPVHEQLPARGAQRAGGAHRLQCDEPVPAPGREHDEGRRRRRGARGRAPHDLLWPDEL